MNLISSAYKFAHERFLTIWKQKLGTMYCKNAHLLIEKLNKYHRYKFPAAIGVCGLQPACIGLCCMNAAPFSVEPSLRG